MIQAEIKELLSEEGIRAGVLFDEPMAGHTTLRIGGPADVFVVPHDVESLGRVLRAARESGIPVLPVGGGSNLLVSDRGIEGVVVSMGALKDMTASRGTGEECILSLEAGVPLWKLLDMSKEEGLTGLEGLAGIPGQVGGAVAGNAGAFGCEMKDVLLSVTLMDGTGNVSTLSKEEVPFGYRTAGIPGDSVIVSVQLKLGKDSPGAVLRRIEDFRRDKRSRQPLGLRSAGCVFKNPVGSPAGRLIEDAGLKGMREGDIEVSGLHANFFINRGRGRAEDFMRLMDEAASRVKAHSGVALEPEIRIVGRW